MIVVFVNVFLISWIGNVFAVKSFEVPKLQWLSLSRSCPCLISISGPQLDPLLGEEFHPKSCWKFATEQIKHILYSFRSHHVLSCLIYVWTLDFTFCHSPFDFMRRMVPVSEQICFVGLKPSEEERGYCLIGPHWSEYLPAGCRWEDHPSQQKKMLDNLKWSGFMTVDDDQSLLPLSWYPVSYCLLITISTAIGKIKRNESNPRCFVCL